MQTAGRMPALLKRGSGEGVRFGGEVLLAPAGEAVLHDVDLGETLAAEVKSDAGAGGLVGAGAEEDDEGFAGEGGEGGRELGFAPDLGAGDDDGVGGEVRGAAEVDEEEVGVGGEFLVDIAGVKGEGPGFPDEPVAGGEFAGDVESEDEEDH